MKQFFDEWGDSIWTATVQTFQMVSVAFLISVVIGMLLSILLVLTRPNQRFANKFVYEVLNVIINIIRSIPFIILLFLILPFTKLVVGTTIGVKGVMVPLVVYTAPFIARLMESALLEVDRGVIEAYEAMGIKTSKVIWHVLLREA
ncbi:MAG TPA: ABC transporter permease subunit, partial [Pseudogracilibacillus sp.]|nr:ABC transporter permease subunit [Pseudogracilibacillus sp.]